MVRLEVTFHKQLVFQTFPHLYSAPNALHHQYMPQPVLPIPPNMQDRDRRGTFIDCRTLLRLSSLLAGSGGNDPRGFNERQGERRRRSRSRSRERDDSK